MTEHMSVKPNVSRKHSATSSLNYASESQNLKSDFIMQLLTGVVRSGTVRNTFKSSRVEQTPQVKLCVRYVFPPVVSFA